MKRDLRPLSAVGKAARLPFSPEVLANALQDRVHRELGKGRAARVARRVAP